MSSIGRDLVEQKIAVAFAARRGESPSGLPAPIQNGGCGCCAGRGSTTMLRKFQCLPWCEKRPSSVHALRRIAMHSSKRSVASAFGMQKPANSAVAVALADAEIEAAAREQIERRHLLGEQHRIVPRQHHHGGAEPQAAGARRATKLSRLSEAETWLDAGEMVLDHEQALR